jgi:hypothetical protein
MKLTPVDPSAAPSRSEYGKILKEFVESGNDVAEVTDYDTSFNNVANCLRVYVSRHDYPVRVFQRKGRIYLLRTEQL